MSDWKDKTKEKIDDAADVAKKAADKIADQSKDVAHDMGKKMEKGGKRLRTRDAFPNRIFILMKHAQIALTMLFCAAAATSFGQEPDNTKVNKRDRNANEPTADQQKVNPTDRELTRQIRRSVMADKSLSTYAHNIKIISQNGAVTLKGPVKSDEERRSIVAKAVAVTGGTDKVIDQISVKQ